MLTHEPLIAVADGLVQVPSVEDSLGVAVDAAEQLVADVSRICRR